MTDCELDTLMQRVLLDSLKLDWEGELKAASSFTPSVRHQREMRAMLADPLGWARKRSQPIWKRITHQAAVILLIISIAFGGIMAVSPEARAAVMQWITEWYETHVTFRYTGADFVGKIPQYEIRELPEGYVEVGEERIEWPNHISILYRNEETGKEIYLDYMYMQKGGLTDYAVEDAEVFSVTVQGFEGFLYLEENWEDQWNSVTWINPSNNLHFSITACLGKTGILNIAEGVFW